MNKKYELAIQFDKCFPVIFSQSSQHADRFCQKSGENEVYFGTHNGHVAVLMFLSHKSQVGLYAMYIFQVVNL